MNRRTFVLSAAGAAFAQSSAARPNIVYILADDLGWGDLPCYNAKSAIPMPNADRLAREGIRFTDMHSGSAVCTPTRYGLLTGRYAWRSRLKDGVLVGDSPNLIEKGRLTLPAMLKQRGYYTAGIGKWHLGLGDQAKTDYSKPLRPGPVDFGFDYYFGIPASLDMQPYLYFENDKTVELPTSTIAERNEPRGVFYRGGSIAPSFKIEDVLPELTRRAVGVIRDRAAKQEPFFLYLALTGPHTPWVPLKEFAGKSKAGLYGDFVTQVDDVVGQVMRALEETGAAKNTVLVFTSDNGANWKLSDKEQFAHRANAEWRGQKADVHEGGHRVPFVVRWPGKVKAGSVSEQTGCLVDFFATAAEMVDFKLPREAAEDSWSLLPAYLGRTKKQIREAVVHHSADGMFSIRQGQWKLVLGLGSGGFTAPKREEQKPGGPGGQLYDLAEDPAESRNLWSSRPDVVARLTTLLTKYRAQGFSRPM